MTRLTRGLPVAVAAVVLLAACWSAAPQGATLPPLTTAVGTTTEAIESTTASSIAATSEETTTPVSSSPESSSESSPVESSAVESVPTEASALPLPTEQVNIPADSPQEEADRAAIEAVWRQVWDLYRTGYDLPPEQIRGIADQILADPIKSQLINGLISGESRNVTSYGQITLHPYWYRAVGNLSIATLGDCADFSQYGEADRTTGEKKTVGNVNANRVGQFVKSPDGIWRLSNFIRVPDIPCSTL